MSRILKDGIIIIISQKLKCYYTPLTDISTINAELHLTYLNAFAQSLPLYC